VIASASPFADALLNHRKLRCIIASAGEWRSAKFTTISNSSLTRRQNAAVANRLRAAEIDL